MCYTGGLIALDFSFGNLGCGKVTESAQEPEKEHICWVKNAVVALYLTPAVLGSFPVFSEEGT